VTWARVVETGSGATAFRLMVLGHPVEWVSSTRLVGASTDGRIRVAGLDAKSIQWGERLDPAVGKLSGTGFTASIVEDGAHRTGDSFVRQPTKVNYLSSSINAAAVAIPLVSTDTVNGDVLFVGQECMLITSGGGTFAPTVTRGYRQTLAQSHIYNPGLNLSRPEVTTEDVGAFNGRPSIKGLIAAVYAYGDGETGDGTLVWRGICGEPRIRGLTSWDLPIGSVTSILDQSMSTDLQDPAQLRGIVYNSTTAPTLRITRLTNTTNVSAPSTDTATVPFPPAFYETQDAWCAAFNAAVTTATAGWGANALNVAGGAAPRLVAVPTVDGAWGLLYTTAASNLWLSVVCGGPLDPTISGRDFYYNTTTGAAVTTVAANTTYQIPATYPIVGAGTVPRGFVGGYFTGTPGRSGGGSGRADVLYMGGTTSLRVGDALYIEWADGSGSAFSRGMVYRVTAWNSTTRAATIAQSSSGASQRIWTRDIAPTVQVARTYVSAGNFGDFMATLVLEAPDEAPLGRSPMVTTNHIDYFTTAANVDAVALGRAWVDQRFYGGSSDFSLSKMIAEELKLLGMVPSITTTGAWTAVEFRIGAATETGTYAINASKNLSGKQRPGYEPSAFGLVNTIAVKSGFDVLTGKHIGDSFNVRDSAALSRQPLPFVMKIEPRSEAFLGDYTMPTADVVALAQGWLGSLGAAYTSITVMCPLDAINATIGAQVSVTISQLPDAVDGGRGISAVSGFVIGRQVKPSQSCVELTIFATQLRIAGYAPSSRVTSVSAGVTRDVLLAAVQPGGYATASAWLVGDRVILRQYNTSGPSEITATVTAVNIATRTITIGTISGATPGGTLNLEYGVAAVATTSQQAYCYIATVAGLIAFGTGNKAARQFAS